MPRKPLTPEGLKKLREQLGWSQQELAEYLGLKDRSQVCHLESGRTAIRGAAIVLLEQLRDKVKEAKTATA